MIYNCLFYLESHCDALVVFCMNVLSVDLCVAVNCRRVEEHHQLVMVSRVRNLLNVSSSNVSVFALRFWIGWSSAPVIIAKQEDLRGQFCVLLGSSYAIIRTVLESIFFNFLFSWFVSFSCFWLLGYHGQIVRDVHGNCWILVGF